MGLIFIFSAYTKFYPIDNFEIFIFGNGIPNWDIASSIARFLISTELFIGIILLVNIYTKKILKLNLILLILFSILLGYLAVFKSDITNCNCFGEHLKFTPIESLIKNIILITVNIFLLRTLYPFKFRFQKLVLIVLFIISFSIPVILSPPDYIYPIKTVEVDLPFKYEYLKEFKNDYNYRNVKDNKALICFYSPHCKFCKLAAKKITIFEKNLNTDLPIYNIFFGEEKDVNQFCDDSESKIYPYQILKPDTFFSLSGSSLPSIYFVNNGIIEKKSGFRSLSQKEVEDFF